MQNLPPRYPAISYTATIAAAHSLISRITHLLEMVSNLLN